MKGSIKNSKFKTQGFRAFFCLFVFFCALCGFAGKISAQAPENLAERIRAGNSEQKRSALFEIRNLRTAEASRTALPALRDSDEIVRATAAFSVIYLPKDEALASLSPNLRDKSEIVRRETAYALGKVQNPAAVNPLIETFQKDKSAEVKNACVVALGEIGDAAAIDFLTGVLRQKPSDDNDFLRRSAARSVGQIAQIIQIREAYTVTPESFLPEKYKSVTLEKYRNLSQTGEQFRRAVPVLIEVLENAREADDAKREAAFALGAIGDRAALSALEKNLNAKDYYLAEICAESVRKVSSAGASD
ncbi:MAG TPA: HEAT repeat domain-containing protein [Pyrinomonadaceae bacterium]